MTVEKISVESIRAWAEAQGLLPTPGPARTTSTEISFNAAMEWATPPLAKYDDLPLFGSPAWVAETDQRRKVASAVRAAVMWALRAEREQTARIEASNEISDAVDWREESKHIGRRESGSYIPRKGAAA